MIRLCPVTHANLWQLAALDVLPHQREWVSSVPVSLMQAYCTLAGGGTALPLGIYEEDVPVGFAMIEFGELPDTENVPLAAGNYCIRRFLIDAHYQRQGVGRRAFAALLDYIRTLPCGPAPLCWISYHTDNPVAARLYASFGFVPNGEKDGIEDIAVLKL